MTADYVLPLNDPQATLAVVGGKGASLARLAQAGLPVPGGFHITTAAYDACVAANALARGFGAALASADAAQPATLADEWWLSGIVRSGHRPGSWVSFTSLRNPGTRTSGRRGQGDQ